MLPIRIPSKNKKKRSGSSKLIIERTVNTISDSKQLRNGQSSRKHITNRSQLSCKSGYLLANDSMEACTSNNKARAKKISLMEQSYGLSLETNKCNRTDSMKQLEKQNRKKGNKQNNPSTKSSISKQKIKNESIETGISTIKKAKKQSLLAGKKKIRPHGHVHASGSGINLVESSIYQGKTNSKNKSRCGLLSKDQIQVNHSFREDEEETQFKQIPPLRLSQLYTLLSGRIGKQAKRSSSGNGSYEQKQYLIREPTQQQQLSKQNTAIHLETVQQKPETQPNIPSPQKSQIPIPVAVAVAQQDRPMSKMGTMQICQESSSILIRKLETQHEAAIISLKQSNSKLQEQLKETYKKYENLILNRNSEISSIENRNLHEQEKMRHQIYEWKAKLQDKDREYLQLKANMEIKLSQCTKDLELERKGRTEEKLNLSQKIAAIQEMHKQIQAKNISMQAQLDSKKQMIDKLGEEKQKYERALRKCEQQLAAIERKLEIEVGKNRKQEKQLQILRKQKKQIRQNSELVLEIVRNEIREMEGKASTEQTEQTQQDEFSNENENFSDHVLKNKDKISPRKLGILKETNF